MGKRISRLVRWIGALDFAGGTVVRLVFLPQQQSSLGLAGAILPNYLPSQRTLFFAGAGLLWFGWFWL